MQASQGRKAGGDGKEESIEGMLRERDGGGRCAEGDMQVTERCWPTGPPEMEVRPQKAAHPIWNYFQKLTDLSANPDMRRTAPESSFQLCMSGWSRVPAEKMLSEKIPGSELGKQRQTHKRDSQWGWMRGNHCLLGSVVTRPAKGNPLCDPHSCSHQASL